MKLRFQDMIDMYIDSEKERAAHDVEITKRGILEDFGFFIDSIKEKVWKLEDITEEDARKYYQHLKYNESNTGQTERKIRTLGHFMEFGVKMGWIDARPWTRLYEHKQGKGRVLMKDSIRKRLLEYLRIYKPEDFFKKRDRAMLLLLLEHKLRMTEISRLNTIDYGAGSLRIITHFAWRTKEIELNNAETEALDEYLLDRRKRKEAVDERALFIGFKRRRIAPGMVKNILVVYIDRLKEE